MTLNVQKKPGYFVCCKEMHNSKDIVCTSHESYQYKIVFNVAILQFVMRGWNFGAKVFIGFVLNGVFKQFINVPRQ